MTPDYSEVNLVDPLRSACLCTEGQPDFSAVTAVAPDGTEHLVLVELAALGDLDAPYDADCTTATHEQPGLLPPYWRHRIDAAPLRCGRTTQTGRPCRAPVTHPGDACGWHRSTPHPQSRQAST